MNPMQIAQYVIQVGIVLFVMAVIGKLIYEQYTAVKAQIDKRRQEKDAGNQPKVI